jgi:hypothetical protein
MNGFAFTSNSIIFLLYIHRWDYINNSIVSPSINIHVLLGVDSVCCLGGIYPDTSAFTRAKPFYPNEKCGGSGIRTHEDFAAQQTFQVCAIDQLGDSSNITPLLPLKFKREPIVLVLLKTVMYLFPFFFPPVLCIS